MLRGVAGRVLTCGCLVGVYETYAGTIVFTIDACGAACTQPDHQLHAVVPEVPADFTRPPTPDQRRAAN